MRRTSVLLTVLTTASLSACGSSEADEATRLATCSDATGDGGSADIVSVELAEDGGDLRSTWTLAAPPNTSAGTLLLSLTAWSEDGEAGRQLGIKWTDGQPGVFSFDLVETQNQDLDVEPTVEGATVSATFPGDAVEGLGETWGWTATTNVDGADVDDCPEPGEDPINPQRQPFPDA